MTHAVTDLRTGRRTDYHLVYEGRENGVIVSRKTLSWHRTPRRIPRLLADWIELLDFVARGWRGRP